jgi:hypothetical protein
MDLVGALSNPDLEVLIQRLTSHKGHHASRLRPRARHAGGWPDGRRKFGSVSGAVIQVLDQAGSDMRVGDIRKRVERLLGGSVAASSVKHHLVRGCRRRPPLFERVSRGRYRLVMHRMPE